MNWMYNAIEVTKYDPKYRGEDGAYLLEEWTDYNDVGKIFNDKIVTLAEYKAVELLIYIRCKGIV